MFGTGIVSRGSDRFLAPCTHYASPTGLGGNDGLTPFTPFRPLDFFAVAQPGKTLCLMDGVYQGAGFMITPFANDEFIAVPIKGTSVAPITIRTLNDGQVRINGQGTRPPVRLQDADWYVVEGFDAHNSSGAVISAPLANNIEFRRIVAWDAKDCADNSCDNLVWNLGGSAGGHGPYLLEDVAGFGLGRKIFQCIGCSSWTVRRAWGRHGGYQSDLSNPRSTITIRYFTQNATIENALMTWSEEDHNQNQSGDGAIASDGSHASPAGTTKVLGSLGYYLCNAVDVSGTSPVRWNVAQEDGTVIFQDVIGAIEAGCWTGRQPLGLSDPNGSGSGTGTATRVSAFGGTGTITLHAAWVDTDVNFGAALANIPDPWTAPLTGPGAGANLCHRYVDGVRQTTPLWPWSMDSRIKVALATAGRAPLAGAAQTVTSEIETLLGTIPAACRRP